MEEKIYFIYAIVDHNEIPFYIGRTKNLRQRMYYHRKDVSEGHNSYKCNKIRKLITDHNYVFKYNIIMDKLTYQESIDEEIRLIKYYRDNDYKLTNLTDGGEGTIGHKPIFTEEWKTKLKLAKQIYFESGKSAYNKGKTLEELIGKERANVQKKRVGDKIREGIKSGRIKTTKGKTLEELVGKDKADVLKIKMSEHSKKIFTGTIQTTEQIKKRANSQSITKQNWTAEQKLKSSIQNKINGEKSIKRYNIKIILPDNKIENVYMSYSQITKLLEEKYNINCNPVSISWILKGKMLSENTKHKCNFVFKNEKDDN